MAEPQKHLRERWFVLFNIACAALAVAFITFLVQVWFNPSGVQARNDASAGPIISSPPAPNNVPSPEYKRDLELLERELSTQDRALAGERDELTRITRLSEYLITLAGVFGLVLGLGSWTILNDQRKAAKEALENDRRAASDALDAKRREFEAKIEESVSASKRLLSDSLHDSSTSLRQVTALRDEVERDFPMFGRMKANFQKVLNGLESACSQLDEQDDAYTRLSWNEVEKILYYENAISTASLLNTTEYSSQLAEIYRLLGVFYGSRFACDKDGKIGSVPQDAPGKARYLHDLYRARFYFDRCLELDATNYRGYFEAGFFTQYTDDLSLARISRDYFVTAATVGKQYQKPLISIALLELEAFRDPQAALNALDSAQERKEYNIDAAYPAPNYISYFRACALCLRIVKSLVPEDSSSLQEALESLSIPCSAPNKYICANFTSDTESFFFVLKDSPLTATQFQELADKVRSSDPKNLPGFN